MGEEPPQREPRTPSSVGETDAGTRDILLLAVFLLLLTITLGVVLVQTWPPPPDPTATGPEPATRARVLFWSPSLTRETRLFVVILATGAVGALIHTLRSLYEYVGNRLLRRSWVLMYAVEPFVGSALALVVYLVLRGGLTTTLASSSDINPYGVTAAAALVGMFSRQTVEKLLAVFETLLAPAERSADRIPSRDGGSDPGGER